MDPSEGGRARALALDPARRSEIAATAAAARWRGIRGPKVARATRLLLEALGEDVGRQGLAETPSRVARAWIELCAGYWEDPAQVLKVFEDGAAQVDEMVTVGPLPFFSMCEHHILPFHGDAWLGYVPDGRIVGLSKVARLLDIFARRLQVQERLTVQVANAFTEHVRPKGVGVHLRARHLCMEMRGVKRAGAMTTTTALRGALFSDPRARAEFLAVCR